MKLFQYGDIGFGINGLVILECLEYAKSVEIPDLIDNKPVLIIGQKAFFSCKELIQVILPKLLVRIDDFAFMGCEALPNIKIPDDVVFIGRRAFRFCTNLSNVILPSGLKEIGDEAFSFCSKLTTINISKQTKLGRDVFPENILIKYYD